MHALLSFSASHLAWIQPVPELESLQIRHGSMALRGLHEMIGVFMPTTADAILATSLLMLWQATNWHSWSSLRAVVQSVSTSVTCLFEPTLIS
jgi:hypothetical protein